MEKITENGELFGIVRKTPINELNDYKIPEISGLNRYKVELQCVPFSFVATVKAFSEKSAIGKARFQAKQRGLNPGKVLMIDIDN